MATAVLSPQDCLSSPHHRRKHFCQDSKIYRRGRESTTADSDHVIQWQNSSSSFSKIGCTDSSSESEHLISANLHNHVSFLYHEKNSENKNHENKDCGKNYDKKNYEKKNPGKKNYEKESYSTRSMKIQHGKDLNSHTNNSQRNISPITILRRPKDDEAAAELIEKLFLKSERLGDEVEKVVEEKRVMKTASSRVRKTVRGTKRSMKQISSKFESLSSDDSIESNNEFRNTPDFSLSLKVENGMQSSLCSTEVLESLANHQVKSKNMDHNHERDKFESFHTSNKDVESTSDYPEESKEMDQNSERNMFVMSERWAGPAFVNSPHPSALPFPCFQRRTKELSPPWQQIHVREGEISATNDLKRILKLNL